MLKHYDGPRAPRYRVTSSATHLEGSRSRLMFSYGLGDAGTGMAATLLGFYLFPFFTSHAGLPAFIAGNLLLVIKVWDGINDPLIGWMSDHTRSRWGPRLPWMFAAALPLGISLAAMWWVPEGNITQRTVYYVLMAILLMTAYTCVNLPYAALSTELTLTTAIRTRLNAARFTGSITAGTLGLLVAVLMFREGGGGSYALMGRITGVIAVTATLLCCWGLAPYAKQAQRPSGIKEPVLQQLRRIRSNSRFLMVLGLYLLLWFGLQLMQVVALIWLVQVIHIPASLATLLLLAFNLAALAGLQLWSMLSNRHGRIRALGWGASIWIAACLLSMIIPPVKDSGSMALIPVVMLILLVGLGASTAYLIPWSLLPDAIDADPSHPAGLYTAWMVLGQKVIIGLSMSVFGTFLQLAGYVSTKNSDGALNFVEQPQSALIFIRLCMGLIPAVLVVMGLVVMRRWPDRGAHLQST